jgi:hypothetical protein
MNRKDEHKHKAKLSQVFSVLIAFIMLSVVLTPAQAALPNFGNKVALTTPEVESPLTAFAAPTFRFFDANADLTLNPTEAVYLDVDATNTVTEHDVRISSPTTGTVGSKVKVSDTDFGRPLLLTAALPAVLTFFDTNGDGAYNINEPVYLDSGAAALLVGANDIRISIPSGSAPGVAGSKVTATDTDAGRVLTAFAGGAALPSFFNNDGTVTAAGVATHTALDTVYIDVNGDGWITPNDIRLSTPTRTGTVGSKVVSTDSDVTRTLVAVAINSIGYFDANADGIFQPTENVYIDTGAVGVTVNDVRIANPVTGTVGSKVAVGNVDVARAIVAFGGSTIRYFDINGDGVYGLGDPVYLDADASGAVSGGDIRLSVPAGSAPAGSGSVVVPANSDVTRALTAFAAAQPVSFFNTDGSLSTVGASTHTATDAVYVDADADGFASVNDVRLSAPSVGVAGSKIVSTDADATFSLAVPVAAITIMYNDADGSAAYNAVDPVYVDMDGSGTVTESDVRLSTPLTGSVGSLVALSDTDLGLALLALGAPASYFDDDGNTDYSTGDSVYHDADGSGTVTALDIRLSSIAGFEPGSKVGGGDSDVNRALTALVAGALSVYNADGTYSVGLGSTFTTGDRAVLDVEGNGVVTVNDIILNGLYVAPPPPDTTAPTFAGLQTAVPGDQQVILSWNAATDSSPPITYSIYQATATGGQSFSSPSFTTQTLSYTVTGLTNNQAYYFVVRATDNVANQDSNVVEKSATPSAVVLDPTDTNGDRIIDMGELMTGIGHWKAGTLSMSDLMIAIGRWKAGSY